MKITTSTCLLLWFGCGVAFGQEAPPWPTITSISVCSSSGTGGQGSCPNGTADTHRLVLGPDGSSINKYVDNLISDEHASVFAPGTLGNNPDYLFYVASGSPLNHDPGALVLSGGNGPKGNGQWTFNYPVADGYGSYPHGFGAVLLPPIATKTCPTAPGGDATLQDQTFDLNYASPGSIVRDPTGTPGSMLMIYESVNHCVGNPGGDVTGKAYLSASIATSLDYGKTWPTYRGEPGSFTFFDLPRNNPSQGPNQKFFAFGDAVCIGNDCKTTTPPANYGRYQVITPATTLDSLMTAGQTLPQDVGDGEISGFVDDASATPAQYVYLLYGGLKIAQAAFNGGAPLVFQKWNGQDQGFASSGMGGADAAIPLGGDFHNCGGPTQIGFGASISFVEDTQQYLLLFVCNSPGEPSGGVNTGSRGGAWMWATTYDLSDQAHWSVPQEVEGSWSPFDTTTDPSGCASYKGFYPTLMSLDHQPEHLGMNGYAFYLWGCQQGGPGRLYSSRHFKISTAGGPSGK
jgi:hypothetical protein